MTSNYEKLQLRAHTPQLVWVLTNDDTRASHVPSHDPEQRNDGAEGHVKVELQPRSLVVHLLAACVGACAPQRQRHSAEASFGLLAPMDL